jgi:hypothetical protein
MSINLLKRMESSVHSFRLTVQRIYEQIDNILALIENFRSGSQAVCK